ncbi:MAG: hypothetical protein R3D51_03260 [Hyphomicrobiaceae bacterium]
MRFNHLQDQEQLLAVMADIRRETGIHSVSDLVDVVPDAPEFVHDLRRDVT